LYLHGLPIIIEEWPSCRLSIKRPTKPPNEHPKFRSD
jgi:hypothetical protein